MSDDHRRASRGRPSSVDPLITISARLSASLSAALAAAAKFNRRPLSVEIRDRLARSFPPSFESVGDK